MHTKASFPMRNGSGARSVGPATARSATSPLTSRATGEACGLVACYAEEVEGVPRGHVISMWVDPAFRRTGVGIMLIDALSSWARSRGLRELKLMVTSVNRGAIDFYQRIGFHTSGKTGPYPNDPAVIEYEMLLPLDH